MSGSYLDPRLRIDLWFGAGLWHARRGDCRFVGEYLVDGDARSCLLSSLWFEVVADVVSVAARYPLCLRSSETLSFIQRERRFDARVARRKSMRRDHSAPLI